VVLNQIVNYCGDNKSPMRFILLLSERIAKMPSEEEIARIKIPSRFVKIMLKSKITAIVPRVR